jgi:hypothetical protein
LTANGVEAEYRSIARSISRWGPKGELDAPIVAESKITDLLRRLKLIQQSDSSILAIGVELEYRFVARSLSGCDPKEEPNALIDAGSKVTDLMRLIRSCSCSFGQL